MLDAFTRPLKDRLLGPLARTLGAMVHPAVVTTFALFAGLAAAWCIGIGAIVPALGLWLLNRVLDGLDGAVARAAGRTSDLGGYVDILADFVVYAAVPAAFAYARPDLAMVVVALMASFYINAASWIYLAAILERHGRGAGARGESTTITMPAGLVAGTETVLLFAVAIGVPSATRGVFILMTILVGLTVGQRLLWAWRSL